MSKRRFWRGSLSNRTKQEKMKRIIKDNLIIVKASGKRSKYDLLLGLRKTGLLSREEYIQELNELIWEKINMVEIPF
jgi:hypothetical protein